MRLSFHLSRQSCPPSKRFSHKICFPNWVTFTKSTYFLYLQGTESVTYIVYIGRYFNQIGTSAFCLNGHKVSQCSRHSCRGWIYFVTGFQVLFSFKICFRWLGCHFCVLLLGNFKFESPSVYCCCYYILALFALLLCYFAFSFIQHHWVPGSFPFCAYVMFPLATVLWFTRPIFLSGYSPLLLFCTLAEVFCLWQECWLSCLLMSGCLICYNLVGFV